MIARLAGLRAFGPALAVFLASRLVIVIAVQFAIRFVPRPVGDGYWDAGIGWLDGLLRWDSGWYAAIVRSGYSTPASDPGVYTAAFYPLYPFAARVMTLFGFNAYVALLIVANVAAICAALLLFQLVREQFDEQTGLLAVGFLGFFPTSFYLSAGYSESMALVFVLCCFLLLRRGQLVAAALCAGLALATRSTGIVLLPVVLLEVWNTHKGDTRRLLGYGLMCGVLAASGLILFMAYQWIRLGDPLRFVYAQVHWHSMPFTDRILSALTLQPFRDVPSEGSLFFLGVGVTLLMFCRRVGLTQAVYGLSVLMLPYLTLSGGPARFLAMSRFVMLAFPFYTIVAQLCRDRTWLAISLLGISGAGLVVYTACFAQWHPMY